ncbi:SDR family oxidoreductase [Amycolatopsis sp. CA-161197]|uniref:SDR family oxidoreductase n=1 Tax=Amycolatopsis sp. CA-161197 TaxID=3239922 RepID=UPI003D8A1D3E
MISAGLTLMPTAGTALYASSKAALDHLVRVAAVELGPKHITVNSVLPGMVRTPSTAHFSDEEIAAEAQSTPLGRIGRHRGRRGLPCLPRRPLGHGAAHQRRWR